MGNADRSKVDTCAIIVCKKQHFITMFDSIALRFQKFAPLFLRFGLAAVFLLFGSEKLLNPEQAGAEIQLIIEISDMQAIAVNYLFSSIEIFIALSFILGIFIRYSSLAAALLIILFFGGIVLKFGFQFDPTFNRDLGLLGASIALYLLGAGPLSIDEWRKKRMQQIL